MNKDAIVNMEGMTQEKFMTLMGWNEVPKFKLSKKNHQIRKLFGKLTHAEMRQEQLDKNKMNKINSGTNRMMALIERGIENVTNKDTSKVQLGK